MPIFKIDGNQQWNFSSEEGIKYLKSDFLCRYVG